MARRRKLPRPDAHIEELLDQVHRAQVQARAGAKLSIPNGFSYTTPRPYCDKAQMEKGRCGVQLIFRDGIPNLRFCTTRKEPGALVPLAERKGNSIVRTMSPQDASKLASEICACWENGLNYEACIPTKYRRKGKLVMGESPVSKGWSSQVPKRTTKRRRQMKKLGRECYLEPGTGKRGSRPKYPVCTQRGSVSCKGTAAAFNRARMQKNKKVQRKALALAKKNGCAWARDY